MERSRKIGIFHFQWIHLPTFSRNLLLVAAVVNHTEEMPIWRHKRLVSYLSIGR